MSEIIKIILADDHAIFRQGIRMLLENRPDFEVIAEAAHGAELQSLVPFHTPDVVLMDLKMPEVDGIEATEWLRREWPDVKIIVLSMVGSDQMMVHLMEKGVHGYLIKNVQADELYTAIEHVVHKGVYLNERVSQALLRAMQFKERTPPTLAHGVTLTEREREVLDLICEGLTSAEIGERLFISTRTTEGHRKNLIAKFEVRNTAALIIKAIKDEWVKV
ncbi:MAG TPA: DNA-binding response regulator [Cytophagales bacterium]|nr:DNA-binding response regulator [Cytophagales bacterium]HAP60021.1 DNA-binding response regulator [Cytophagales bacterium]